MRGFNVNELRMLRRGLKVVARQAVYVRRHNVTLRRCRGKAVSITYY
jgi:hypothetical protein